MELLTSLSERGIAAWHDLSFPKQIVVGAIGLALAYLLFGRIVRVGRSIATLVLVIVIVVAGVRFAFPKFFCSLSWPAFVSSNCSL
jgi:hypothetical protein